MPIPLLMLSSSPDLLFARFRETGEPEALARLFDRVAPQLLRVAQHLARDGAEAEDVVQATFVAAIEGVRRFEPGSSVLPWLLGILARQAASARRKEARRVDPERLPERPDDDPALESERVELRQAVAAALTHLPERYGRVLVLHLAEGLRPEEIARDLGRRPGTVRVQLHRALRLLRRALPASLATGVACHVPTRGLAALRSEVMRHAASVPYGPSAGGAAGLGSSSLAGALVMSKTAGIAAVGGAAALALSLVFLSGLWPEDSAAVELARQAPQPLEPVAEGRPAVAQHAAPAEDAPRRVEVETDATGAPVPPAPLGFRVFGRVVARDRQPVADAEVCLSLAAAAPGERARPLFLMQRSTRDGGFSFDDLDVGLRGVTVRAAGFAPCGAVPWDPKDEPVRFLPGESRDLGEFVLEPGVRLRGRVVDALTGEGLAGPLFQVLLYPQAFSEEGLRGYVVATAGATGRFEVHDLLAYSTGTSFDYGFFAATERGIGWARLVLLEGDGHEREVEIPVHPGAALIVDVVDSAGRPLSGATVRVHPRFAPFDILARFEPEVWTDDGGRLAARFRATTGAEGTAAFASLPLPAPDEGAQVEGGSAAEYVVTVTAPGEAEAATRSVVLDPRRTTRLSLSPFEDGFEIAGSVRDEEGAPIAGALLSCGPSRGHTDERGAFRVPLDRAQGERFLLRVAADGFGAREHEFVVPATDLEGVELVLGRRRPVSGVVVDEQDRPVAGAWTSLSRPYDDRSAQTDPGRLASLGARVGEDGRFRFEDATGGPWIVMAHPPFGEPGWLGPERLRVEGGCEDARVVLRRSEQGRASVVVEVFDADTGEPLDPEQVQLASRADPFAGYRLSGSEVRRVSGAVIVEGLEAGSWRLWVRVGEREPGYVDLDVAAGGGEQRLRLELGGRGTIAGRVRGVQSDPAMPARLSFSLEHLTSVPYGPAWESSGLTDGLVELAPDGGFRLAELRPGRYLLALQYGYQRAEKLVELAPGDETWVELAPEPAAWLTVRGPDPGEPGFVRVIARHPELGWTSVVHYAAREGGEFQSGLLVPPGRIEWEVRFRSDDQPSAAPEREVHGAQLLTAGETTEVVARLPAP